MYNLYLVRVELVRLRDLVQFVRLIWSAWRDNARIDAFMLHNLVMLKKGTWTDLEMRSRSGLDSNLPLRSSQPAPLNLFRSNGIEKMF
jgi:hypothetical protein